MAIIVPLHFHKNFKICLLISLKIWFFFMLLYCIGFAIHQHASAMGVHAFPILNPPPTSLPIPSLWVIQCTNPEHPVSCIEPGLVIRFTYDNIHVSMPFSQIIPPATESKRLFYTSASLLLSCIQGYLLFKNMSFLIFLEI